MEIEKMNKIMRTQGGEATADLVVKLRNEQRVLKADAEAAVMAYLNDVAAREARLHERIAALSEQSKRVSIEIKQMKPALVKASVTGDDAGVMSVQEKIAQKEATLASIAAQVEMLNEAEIPGSKELYEAAIAKNAENEESISRLEESEGLIIKYAIAQRDAWMHVINMLTPAQRFIMEGEDVWGRHLQSVAEVEEHYRRTATPSEP